MTVQEIIDRLSKENPETILKVGFANPHSYRGSYNELAFEPVKNIAIKDMLEALRASIGREFTGYKGGEYLMSENTECNIAHYGSSGIEINSPLLEFMLGNYGYLQEYFF